MGKARDKRGEFSISYLIGLLIALVVLGLGIWLYFKIHTRGESLLDFIKNLWRFGR